MHLWCRVCEHIDVNTCTCQAGPALFLWPWSTNTAYSIMLILTLFPRHPLMLHRPAPSSYLVSTRRPLPGASCHCHAVCCVCQRVGLIMKLLNQPSWTGHWLHQLPAAAAGRGETEFKFSRLSAGAAGCGWRGAAAAGPVRAGRCGAGRAAAVCTTHQSGPSHPSVHTAVHSPAQRALATPWYHCAHRSVRARSASSPAALHKLEVKINGKHLRSDSAWPAECAIGKVKLNKFNNNHQWGAGSQIHTVPHRVIIRPLKPVSEVSVQLGVVICSNDGKTLVMTSSPCHTTTQLSLEVEFHNIVHHKYGKSDSKCCLMLVTEAEVTKHVPKRLYTTML